MATDVRVAKLLTVRELEAVTGVGAWRWYEMFKQGSGPAHMRIGNTIRVSETALAKWIESKQET